MPITAVQLATREKQEPLTKTHEEDDVRTESSFAQIK